MADSIDYDLAITRYRPKNPEMPNKGQRPINVAAPSMNL